MMDRVLAAGIPLGVVGNAFLVMMYSNNITLGHITMFGSLFIAAVSMGAVEGHRFPLLQSARLLLPGSLPEVLFCRRFQAMGVHCGRLDKSCALPPYVYPAQPAVIRFRPGESEGNRYCSLLSVPIILIGPILPIHPRFSALPGIRERRRPARPYLHGSRASAARPVLQRLMTMDTIPKLPYGKVI